MQYDPQGYPKEPGDGVKVYLHDILLDLSLSSFLVRVPLKTLTIRGYFQYLQLTAISHLLTLQSQVQPRYAHLLQRFRSESLSTRTIVVEQRHKSVRDPTYYNA